MPAELRVTHDICPHISTRQHSGGSDRHCLHLGYIRGNALQIPSGGPFRQFRGPRLFAKSHELEVFQVRVTCLHQSQGHSPPAVQEPQLEHE